MVTMPSGEVGVINGVFPSLESLLEFSGTSEEEDLRELYSSDYTLTEENINKPWYLIVGMETETFVTAPEESIRLLKITTVKRLTLAFSFEQHKPQYAN